MRYSKISITAFITFILTVSIPVTAKLPAFLQVSQISAQTADARKAEVDILLQQGSEQYQTSQFTAALQSWQKALAIARQIKDSRGEGQSLGNLGNAYFSLGDYAKAIDYYQQRLVIARQIKDRQGEGAALGNLGIAYRALGEYAKAIDYYQQSLAIARQIQDHLGEGAALGNLGIAYFSLGDYAKAIDYHQQSLAIARQIQYRLGEGQSLGNLGNAYHALGEYAKAKDYYQQSLAIARQIQDRQGQGNGLAGLGLAYLYLGDYAKAIDYHQQYLAIARQIKDRQGEGNGLNNLGLTFYKQGNLTLAESTLLEGIKVLESLRGRELKDSEKVSIFETQRNTYRTLQQVLIAQNKPDAALEISERGRGRAFVELLASRLSANSQEKLPTSPTITEIKQIAKQQNATLVQYSIIYDRFKIQGKQQVKESELYVWVIKPTGEVTFRKADLKPLWQKENTNLAELVTTSRQSIGARGILVSENPDAPQAKQKLRRLHELLIEPIADLLPTNENERVTFVPQDELFLVPFPALRDAENKYLIEKHTILTAPSIQVLDLTRQQQVNSKKSGEVLLVGNPKMPKVVLKPGQPPEQLTNLKWAEKEAKDIASLFGTQAITGDKATETAIVQQMTKARIIHLATHGILDNFRGLGSAIALTPSNQDDGLLTAEEIFNLKLNADLVVLSACDTGRGRITGDGVIGLSRSFITAGVPSVIVSLWAVDDNSTSMLMTKFYQNLEQNLDKATALRNAMLSTMKTHPSPKYWAAFTLIGEVGQ